MHIMWLTVLRARTHTHTHTSTLTSRAQKIKINMVFFSCDLLPSNANIDILNRYDLGWFKIEYFQHFLAYLIDRHVENVSTIVVGVNYLK